MKIIIKEIKPKRFSMTMDEHILKAIHRWAISYVELGDAAAIEVTKNVGDYFRRRKAEQQHFIWKSIKAGIRKDPLTESERMLMKGTRYVGFLKERGWL